MVYNITFMENLIGNKKLGHTISHTVQPSKIISSLFFVLVDSGKWLYVHFSL
jgi:hypothetical protein